MTTDMGVLAKNMTKMIQPSVQYFPVFRVLTKTEFSSELVCLC